MKAKLINKKTTKLVAKKCFFCGNDNYAVLDCHRIVPEEEGGRYVPGNVVVCCACCHRLVHDGQIRVDRWYPTTAGKDVLHFWENEEEKWETEKP